MEGEKPKKSTSLAYVVNSEYLQCAVNNSLH